MHFGLPQEKIQIDAEEFDILLIINGQVNS